MTETIIVALITFLGSLIGTFLSNSKSKALIAYRLEQLEKKVNLHNNVVERTYELERKVSVLESKVE
jgi:hypothetical protein